MREEKCYKSHHLPCLLPSSWTGLQQQEDPPPLVLYLNHYDTRSVHASGTAISPKAHLRSVPAHAARTERRAHGLLARTRVVGRASCTICDLPCEGSARTLPQYALVGSDLGEMAHTVAYLGSPPGGAHKDGLWIPLPMKPWFWIPLSVIMILGAITLEVVFFVGNKRRGAQGRLATEGGIYSLISTFRLPFWKFRPVTTSPPLRLCGFELT